MKLFKGKIGTRYKIADLGSISWLLGMKVTRDQIRCTISLSQETYVNMILTEFNFLDQKPISIPMDPNIQLSHTQSPKMILEIAYMKIYPIEQLLDHSCTSQ